MTRTSPTGRLWVLLYTLKSKNRPCQKGRSRLPGGSGIPLSALGFSICERIQKAKSSRGCPGFRTLVPGSCGRFFSRAFSDVNPHTRSFPFWNSKFPFLLRHHLVAELLTLCAYHAIFPREVRSAPPSPALSPFPLYSYTFARCNLFVLILLSFLQISALCFQLLANTGRGGEGLSRPPSTHSVSTGPTLRILDPEFRSSVVRRSPFTARHCCSSKSFIINTYKNEVT